MDIRERQRGGGTFLFVFGEIFQFSKSQGSWVKTVVHGIVCYGPRFVFTFLHGRFLIDVELAEGDTLYEGAVLAKTFIVL